MLPIFFFVFLLFFSSSYNAAVQDFCVADLTASAGPAGHPCKDPSTLTIDDFVFTGFRTPADTANDIMSGVKVAFTPQFPAVNGLNIAAARMDVEQGGVVPLHSHPGGTELFVAIKGTFVAGFISSANKVYYKTLEEGDVIVFPQGLLNFQFNAGNDTATAFMSYSSSNPGLQLTSSSLFGNDLPTEIVHKVTFLDDPIVRAYKVLLGGSN